MTAKPNDEGSGWTPNVRNVVVYSVAILAMPIIGEQVGELLPIWHLLELIAAAIGITTVLGAIFGLARIAGTPVLILIIIHGLVDLPEMIARFIPMASM